MHPLKIRSNELTVFLENFVIKDIVKFYLKKSSSELYFVQGMLFSLVENVLSLKDASNKTSVQSILWHVERMAILLLMSNSDIV